jgi:hypothetical protein
LFRNIETRKEEISNISIYNKPLKPQTQSGGTKV